MSKLIYADTKNSNMFYAVKSHISDPFLYLEIGRKKYVFLDHREFAVFKENNRNKKIEIILVEDLLKKALKLKNKTLFPNKLILTILREFDLLNKEIKVPSDFPIFMADFLRNKQIKITPVTPFFPKRKIKSKAEIKLIKENIKNTLEVFKKIENILKESEIKKDKIYFQGKILTSEFLKYEVEKILLEKNMTNQEGLIISSGYQTAIPHHRGSGEIKPNTFIICDIFPRNRENGYFADITRTYVKGKTSKRMMKIFNAVKKVQVKAIKSIKAGVEAKKINEICEKSFEKDGFKTRGGRGFIHSTGHSFGLDVHEKPYLGKLSEDVLEAGNVVTVEPGLYFPKFGGVRIEDDILVTKDGSENLVDYPKVLVIK
ncbi:MAG: aminopeptidase P family protein [Candidatus Moranbacteria bacterium]|nr:aminopeptidase P family protein [Candidatus Moranbacteria bacterium]